MSLSLIWTIVNSPIGVTCLIAVVGYALQALVKAKPAWVAIYEQNKGHFFDAVKLAEQVVPVGTPGSGAAKAKIALDYLLKLEHPLADLDPKLLVHGIEAAHAAGAADLGTVIATEVTTSTGTGSTTVTKVS